MRTFIDFGSDRERGDKPVPGYEVRILYAQTTPQVPPVNAQDLDAVLQRKYAHCIRLTHKRVALVHVNRAVSRWMLIVCMREPVRTSYKKAQLTLAHMSVGYATLYLHKDWGGLSSAQARKCPRGA